MTRHFLRCLILIVVSLLAAQATQTVYPGEDWERLASPETAGYSRARLEALRTWLKTADTSAMIVIHRGRVLFEHGDVKQLSYLASCRKSLLAMLYGNYVASGKIRLNATLAELGIDDHGGLSDSEKQATVDHLIMARSGVYHAASNDGDDLASAPPRGSQKSGTYYLYSNWDFNAAGGAFESMTGKDIYDAFESDIARPIGMQDFNRSTHKKSGNPEKSRFLAYHFTLSTRDMARVGYLMLREGLWRDRPVVPREWTRKITSLVTPAGTLNPVSRRGHGYGRPWGYGYMWWVWDSSGNSGPFTGAYTAMGAFGQYITVLPALDLVIAHKTLPGRVDGTDRPRNVDRDDYQAILQMLIMSRCKGPCT